MTHLNEEQLVNGYYEGLSGEAKLHLEACADCAALYQSIRETLDPAADVSVPERGADYGREVWARVAPRLDGVRPRARILQGWMLAAAAAAGIAAAAFFAGMAAEQKRVAPVSTEVKAVVTPNLIKAPVGVAQMPPKAEERRRPIRKMMVEQHGSALPELVGMINGNTPDKTKEHALFELAQSSSPEAHKALMEIASQTDQPALQTKALTMLTVAGGEGAHKELTALYTTSSNPELKRKILNEWMIAGSKATLLEVAKSEPDASLRNSAIANLSFTGGEAELSQLYRSGAPYDEKKQILNSVYLTGDANMLAGILKQEKDPALRMSAITTLAGMNGGSEELVSVYRTEKDDAVREAILDALAGQHDELALGELARQERDSDKRDEIYRRMRGSSVRPARISVRP